MAYEEQNFEESLGWCVLVGVILLLLALGFTAWMVLGPGRIERRDVRQANARQRQAEADHALALYCEQVVSVREGRIVPEECALDPETVRRATAAAAYREARALRGGTRPAPLPPSPCIQTKVGPTVEDARWSCTADATASLPTLGGTALEAR